MPAPSISVAPAERHTLSEADAVDIWIARWLRIRRKDLLLRYGCDPRRLYEIWEEKRFPGSRAKALAVFGERHPGLADRIDFGLHRRIPRRPPPELQPGLFDAAGLREQTQNFCSTWPANRGMFSLRSPAVSTHGERSPVPRCPREPDMRTYLITFDTNASTRHQIASAIMQLGEAWARPLDATWYVQSNDRPTAVEARLKRQLDVEAGLLIQEVETSAILLNTALHWFKKRKPQAAAEASNVVAFPAPALPEARAA